MILEQIKVSVETSSLVLNNILQQFQSMIMIPLKTFAETTEEANDHQQLAEQGLVRRSYGEDD